MDVPVCPSCGFNLGAIDPDTYKTKCRNCGRTVPITGHLGTTAHVVPNQPKGPSRWKTLPKKILVISILATVAAGGFALVAREFTPTTLTVINKTPYADLNTEEIDDQLVSEGFTALYYKGWTETDTVTYIETRVAELEANNESTREYIAGGMRASELNARSTASDVQLLSKEEIQTMREEIEAREARIKKLQWILADHRRRNRFY